MKHTDGAVKEKERQKNQLFWNEGRAIINNNICEPKRKG
jgi:hypothetical protein